MNRTSHLSRTRAVAVMLHLSVALLVCPMVLSAEPPAFETPTLEHVLTVRASLDPMVEMGKTPEGVRRVVPISGGAFEGPTMKGTIMPGGEDWQLVRDDGVMQLDARYWLRTEDGAVIRVNNQVLAAPPAPGAAGRYVRSLVKIEAPVGKYDWLNKAVFVGTLTVEMDKKPAVVVLRFFKVN